MTEVRKMQQTGPSQEDLPQKDSGHKPTMGEVGSLWVEVSPGKELLSDSYFKSYPH